MSAKSSAALKRIESAICKELERARKKKSWGDPAYDLISKVRTVVESRGGTLRYMGDPYPYKKRIGEREEIMQLWAQFSICWGQGMDYIATDGPITSDGRAARSISLGP